LVLGVNWRHLQRQKDELQQRMESLQQERAEISATYDIEELTNTFLSLDQGSA